MSTRRYVVPHPRGWAVKAANTRRASSVHPTQHEATSTARRIVANRGGGTVVVRPASRAATPTQKGPKL